MNASNDLHSQKILIKVNETFEALTEESRKHRDAPWAGLKSEQGPNHFSRLKNLMEDYVHQRIHGCSVLIGGDRGAGKTSTVLKAIEQLSTFYPEDQGLPAGDEYKLKFPRPLLVRLHGPKLFLLTELDQPPSRHALRLIAEAICSALTDEFGTRFSKLATEPQKYEMAAQFRLDLERQTDPAHLRQMWALFSGDHWTTSNIKGVLPEETEKGAPLDQGYREILAITSAIQLCEEIRHQRQAEAKTESAKKQSGIETEVNGLKASGEPPTFWKILDKIFIEGGRIVHPLAGILVGLVITFTLARGGSNYLIPILAGLLAGITTAIVLNFAASRIRQRALLADSTLASLDRTIPSLLRKIEAAGLFPIIVVDELDKVLNETATEQEQWGRKMDTLIRDLKYFVADQAFTCFLTSRHYFNLVLKQSHGPALQRSHVDTFFADRLLVSHHPEELNRYLDNLLSHDQSTPTSRNDFSFLKNLYLFRAKGHLWDLNETVIRDTTDCRTIFIAKDSLRHVPSYKDQVFYQLAVQATVGLDTTVELLRQRPDQLEELHRVLYEPARIWEHAQQDSFTLDEVLRDKSLISPHDGLSRPSSTSADLFKSSLDYLLGFLAHPERLAKSTQTLNSDFAVEQKFLIEELKQIKPLLHLDTKQFAPRYFWTRELHLVPDSQPRSIDSPDIIQFRSNKEQLAAQLELRAIDDLMQAQFVSPCSVFDLVQIRGFLDFSYTPALEPRIIRQVDSRLTAVEAMELAEFYSAVKAKRNDLKTLFTTIILTDSLLKELKSTRQIQIATFLDPENYLMTHKRFFSTQPTSDAVRLFRRMENSDVSLREWAVAAKALLSRCQNAIQ